MIGLTLVTAPTVEPLTVDEARRTLRVDLSDEDGEIADLITAARVLVEERTRRRCLTQTWDYAIDSFPVRREPLIVPYGPLQSVTSVTVYDESDVASVWSSANYVVDTRMAPGRLMLTASASWPRSTRRQVAGVVRFVCGHGLTRDTVPMPVRQAMKVALLALYERRAMTMDEERAVEALVSPWTVSSLVGSA